MGRKSKAQLAAEAADAAVEQETKPAEEEVHEDAQTAGNVWEGKTCAECARMKPENYHGKTIHRCPLRPFPFSQKTAACTEMILKEGE